jgi:hypothetical protein
MMPFVNIQIQLVDLPAVSDTYMEPWVPSLVRPADLCLIVADLASGSLLEELAEVLAILERSKVTLVSPANGETPAVGWARKPAVLAANKLDAPDAGDALEILRAEYEPRFPVCAVSAQTGQGLETLRRTIYDGLNIVRVYCKPPGEDPSMKSPVVLPRGSTVVEMAESIHKDFAHQLKFARIWGSGKFDGQRVQRDYIVQDGDIFEFHI